VNSLLRVGRRPIYEADDGKPGGPRNRSGSKGEDRVVNVPIGTQIFDAQRGNLLRDLMHDGDTCIVAAGGRGGRGNKSFASAIQQAPRRFESGAPGEARRIRLELKLIADVGLLGAPNAGKSTLLSRISAARPRIGDYPFTTLHPVLGVVEQDEQTFVTADIPGIIEGAHQGAGLGLQFLRHVERTRVLVYVVDASGACGNDPVADLLTVRAELLASNPSLLERPALVAATKRDAVSDPDPLPALEQEALRLGLGLVAVSAASGLGLVELKRGLLALLAPIRAADPVEAEA
jgi:GTP-binding protein